MIKEETRGRKSLPDNKKRIRMSARIAPTTQRALDKAMKKTGFNLGRVLDAWAESQKK